MKKLLMATAMMAFAQLSFANTASGEVSVCRQTAELFRETAEVRDSGMPITEFHRRMKERKDIDEPTKDALLIAAGVVYARKDLSPDFIYKASMKDCQ